MNLKYPCNLWKLLKLLLTLQNRILDENVAIKQDFMKSNGLYVLFWYLGIFNLMVLIKIKNLYLIQNNNFLLIKIKTIELQINFF